MTAHPPTAPCEVCGAETTTRCASCAQVGIDLFFCSRDCQKLVWRGHKLLCGSGGSAGPVKLPSVTDDEVDFARTHADAPPVPGCSVRRSIRRELESLAGQPFEYVLQNLSGSTDSTGELPNKPVIATHLRAIHYRMCRIGTAERPETPLLFLLMTHQQVLIYQQLVENRCVPPMISTHKWHDLLCHKLAIAVTLDQRIFLYDTLA
ncbi:hypothetical protein RTG_02002 [Rhodotorula toruloides ATCC 204091]|uniref:MYND-type domain-containing protein n=1 Tax=Rhodotorula toruloides TaxID=5286 RepID=A0A0K3CKA8_RHOTO|nr:hypothetical protein RTG_02002 [Rhodotorula toruloides ATCC 204091]KAK4334076.1 MYND-type domain-containing protein [Rhodotorula toruloides]PRQ72433.1 hypothetical protein AAT19DRAFT_16357 [Rhodotorula toruloides]